MSYPRQISTLNRLEKDSQKHMDTLIDSGQSQIHDLWSQAKDYIRHSIIKEYRTHHHDGWNHAMASNKGTLVRIDRDVERILYWFKSESGRVVKTSTTKIYQTAVLRQAWMLDMVTPRSLRVRLPHTNRMIEAVRYAGNMNDWETRWDAWLAGYRSNLYTNIKMGAINESSMEDAADEVDKTRVGTPSYDLDDALARIYLSTAVYNESLGIHDLQNVNGDLIEEEIWQTRYDDRICDDCDENKGLTIEETDGDIPLHPNCRCYWRLVPKEWAELLKTGDLDDLELAKMIDARGFMPSSMITRDEDGATTGALIISFQEWVKGQSLGIRAAA